MVKNADRETVVTVARKILRVNQADWKALPDATQQEELARTMRAIKGIENYMSNTTESGPDVGGVSDPKAIKQIGRIVFGMDGNAWEALSVDAKTAKKNDCRRIIMAVDNHLTATAA